MSKPIVLALLLTGCLGGLANGSAAAQSDSLTADPAPQIFDPSSGNLNIQDLMEATRNQENRANRSNIGSNVDAEVERFRQLYRVGPDREPEE